MWNKTGLLDRYGEMAFTMTDSLALDPVRELTGIDRERINDCLANGHLTRKRWFNRGNWDYTATNDTGVKLLSELQYKLEP